jgi:hypothetical protein
MPKCVRNGRVSEMEPQVLLFGVVSHSHPTSAAAPILRRYMFITPCQHRDELLAKSVGRNRNIDPVRKETLDLATNGVSSAGHIVI